MKVIQERVMHTHENVNIKFSAHGAFLE